MDLQIISSIGQGNSRDVDIDTHYDQLLSSGLEEINDLSEMKNTNRQTEPLDSTKIPNHPQAVTSYDVTTISKGPLTEIYEQKVTINLNTDESRLNHNEIDQSTDVYGLESRYSFRKLQQFIEEEPIFRPQRDFTRLRRPPGVVIVTTASNPNLAIQPTQSIPVRNGPRPFVARARRPTGEFSNDDISTPVNSRNGFRGSFARRPDSFRPLVERRPVSSPNFDNELNVPRISPVAIAPSQPISVDDDLDRVQDLLSSLQNGNRNPNSYNGFSGSPVDTESFGGFRPLNNPIGLRRGPGPALEDDTTRPESNLRPRRLRVTRPVNPDESQSSGVRRVVRIRPSSIETLTPVSLENEIKSTSEYNPATEVLSDPVSSGVDSTESDDTEEASSSLEGNDFVNEGENVPSRRTVIKKLRPSFVPGDGSGPRRPLVVRRTKFNEQPSSTVSSEPTETTPPVPDDPETEETTEGKPTESALDLDNENKDLSESEKPPVKKIVRLRKPENGDPSLNGARRRVVISRKPPGADTIVSNAVQGRGPVSGTVENVNGHRNNLISDNNHLYPNSENDLDSFDGISGLPNNRKPEHFQPAHATRTFPITYYTSLTYYTTFLHGPNTNYASREAIFSNVIEQTLNPNLVAAIQSRSGLISPTNGDSILHLASRTLGDTTTIVNLASKQNIYNSEVFKLLNEPAIASTSVHQPDIRVTPTQESPILRKTDINAIASLPKTYLTLFTYSYTFFDGTNRRESTRAETMTNVATDPIDFQTDSLGSYVNADGLLNVGPETKTVHLGSRNLEGTTTEVNLGLKTLLKIDGLRNVVLERTPSFQYITPSRTVQPEPQTATTSSYETLRSSIHLDSSYASANDLSDANRASSSATETSPLLTAGFEEANNALGSRQVVKITSVIHKPTGPLRSGVFEPRPGVRVRVRPVVSRRLVPSDLASSFDLSFDVNELSTERQGGQFLSSPQFVPHMVVPTPALEEHYLTNVLVSSDGNNEIVSDEFEVAVDDVTSSDGMVVPTKKKLKVTVRRPQSESVSRTHTRFVLPSRFEITSRPRFYVVTRTGALGVVSNTQRPFTVKISRKLKPTAVALEPLGLPSTTVIYDTYTTLTSVPVIFGLDTSFRNVLLTTSSPITVSFVPTPSPVAPSTVVLTYFTTTTFTIPYVVGDETLHTTLEETNSRIVTQTLDGIDSLSYTTITRTPAYNDVLPTVGPITSVEFGFDGPTTHTLSHAPKEQFQGTPEIVSKTPAYETKTFYTTYTFFSTFFAGTDAVVSSSEQVITNVVTVPITTTEAIQPSYASSEMLGPLTVFDTSETVFTKTNYNTITFYATLFSDTSSFVTPIEEVETQLQTITETYTITRTIMPTSASIPTTYIEPTRVVTPQEPSVVVTQTLYTTFTNFVTLFQGTDTVVTNLEEVVSNLVTLTVPASVASSFSITPTSTMPTESTEFFFPRSSPIYTTREVLSTQTHFLTLFNNDQSMLSSIEEVVTSYVTELMTASSPTYASETYFPSTPQLSLVSPQAPSYSTRSFVPPFETTETESEVETYHPELVPSIRTIFSTITFYTTYFSDTSSIVASQEEILTSYVTLFVPPSLITSSTTTTELTIPTVEPTSTTDPSFFVFTTTDYSTLTLYTTLFSGNEIVVISSEHVVPEIITATITPSSTTVSAVSTADESVLTFLTTFTYYTTYFSGADPVIASSESVVTQFVTIEAPPSVSSTSEVVINPTSVDETILGVSTASGGDISSSFKEDFKDIEIIGVSSAIATGVEIQPSVETKIQVESKVHSEVGSTPVLFMPDIPSRTKDTSSSISDVMSSFSMEVESDKPSMMTPDSTSTPATTEFSMDSEGTVLPVTSRSVLTEETELIGVDGKITTLVPSDTLVMVTGTDGFVTKLAEVDSVGLSPVYIPTTKEPSPSASSEIKPATVIELSDLLGGNTALGGDIGLAIQDIVSRITGKKNKTETDGVTTDITTELTTEDQKVTEPTTDVTKFAEGRTVSEDVDVTLETSTEKELKDVDYPIFVLSSKVDDESSKSASPPVYVAPEIKETTYSAVSTSTSESEKVDTKSIISSHSISTSVITGARTVFIVPTKQADHDQNKDKYSVISDTKEDTRVPRLEVSKNVLIDSSMTSFDKNSKTSTPQLAPSIGTSIISGIKTIFFGSDASKSEHTTQNMETLIRDDSILGRANAPIDKPKTFTTITQNGQTVVSRKTSGATTIFFPGQIPKYTNQVTSTRYVTSVESITRTLALTTTRTYYTRDSTLTVPSVYTTTIPPRTFVSTIIGTRTILGILPEPTETVQIHKTNQPSELTTVTTTTLIFNSIPSTVVRTLVLPTGVPTRTIGSNTPSSVFTDSNVFSAGTERPARPPEAADSTSAVNPDSLDPIERSSTEKRPQKSRDETYLRAAGPRLHDFRQDVEPMHRPPIVVTESVRPEDDPFMNGRNGICDPKCQPYKKEACKESKGLWTCQCRPGHARRDDHEICKEIQTYVVLLKVVKMGNESVNFSSPLADNNSQEYKDFVRSAKEGIEDAYSITHVKDHIWDAEVNNILPGDVPQNLSRTTQPSLEVDESSGVIVNFTLQVSKSVSGSLLEQELTRALQSSGMRIGDSALLAAPLSQNVQDYDECLDPGQNDCALRATCVNLEGSFTCQCEEGYEDMDRTLPGRVCLAKTEKCNYCHGRGDCLRGDDDKTFCRCQPMFVGRRCEINGLVLAIALPTAVAVVALLLCFALCCCRKCRKKTPTPGNGGDPGSVFRGIALKGPVGGTLDRKAMIDTSSESSGEHARKGMPFEGYQESGDVTPFKSSKRSDLSLNRSLSTGYTSPPVMIPRAKQPQPPNKPMNYTVYDGQVYVW